MPQPLNCKSILVARGGALGDFVLTLPVLAALRARFPAARLEILGYPRIASLAQAGGLADAVRPIESPALASFFAPGAADLDANPWLASFDLIVSYLYDSSAVLRANIQRAAPNATFLSGPHRPDENAGIHAAGTFLKPLEALGILGADPIPRLNIPAVEPPSPMAQWLALHPGSGSERKNWPEEKWAGLLCKILEKTAWSCLLVGGEAEEPRLARLQNFVTGMTKFCTPRVALAQNWPLPKLAATLRCCAGFVGHDSGVTHLAAALGLAGLVLWGESNQNVWRPRSDAMTILRHAGGLSRLPVADVFGNLPRIGHSFPNISEG